MMRNGLQLVYITCNRKNLRLHLGYTYGYTLKPLILLCFLYTCNPKTEKEAVQMQKRNYEQSVNGNAVGKL